MKNLITILSLTSILILLISSIKPGNKDQAVNSVIGDISFIKKFGMRPDKNTDENLRIKTHLEYVENALRNKNVSKLPEGLRQKRLHLLNLLHNYRLASIFPRNYEYKDSRKPCFIDKDNMICAVGYLIEKTAGRKMAEMINHSYKYEYLAAMNSKEVNSWLEGSGLTKEECAMIQPNYGPAPGEDHIPASYGITSSALSGINFSLNAINAVQMIKGTNSKTVPIIGLFTGAGQIILGAASFPKPIQGPWGNTTNESKKAVSMLNIGLGTTTMILSAWSLIHHKKIKDRATSWNIYTTPAERKKLNVGFSVTRKI